MKHTLKITGSAVVVYVIVAACASRPSFESDAGGIDGESSDAVITDALLDPVGEAKADPPGWMNYQAPCIADDAGIKRATLMLPGKAADLIPVLAYGHGNFAPFAFAGQVGLIIGDGIVRADCGPQFDYIVFSVPK